MKKMIAILAMLIFSSTVGFADASYISTQFILNRCFDETTNTLKATLEVEITEIQTLLG